MKVKDVLKALRADGWEEVRQESSHRTFKKTGVDRNVVVNGHESVCVMKVDIVLERAGGNWCAYAPDLEDVVTATGKTREETVSRFRDALRGLADYKRKEGKSFPKITELEIRETVAV